MKVTDVKIRKNTKEDSKTKYFATITFDEEFVFGGVTVVDGGEKGLFVAMPNYKDKEGKYHDQSFPLTAELRADINEKVLAKVNEEA